MIRYYHFDRPGFHYLVCEAIESGGAFAAIISSKTEASAIQRGSGIFKRCAASIQKKMMKGEAVIAVTEDNEWAGFHPNLGKQ